MISGISSSNLSSFQIGSIGNDDNSLKGDIFDMLLANLSGTNISIGNNSGNLLDQSSENANTINNRGILV